jgi:hypothetical protein
MLDAHGQATADVWPIGTIGHSRGRPAHLDTARPTSAQRQEDQHDVAAARRALAKRKGRRIPYAKARKALGLA